MSETTKIIELYTELAQNPKKDFGWEKGIKNAIAHSYKQEWLDAIPAHVWEYCAAVGNPFLHAQIKEGDTVVDLGCGAGIDMLVASLLVGESESVFGVDITPKMVELSRDHAKELGVKNIQVLESSFDSVALQDESVDVIISNGAINLTSCKESVFSEIYRLLKPNGKIFFADMIDISQSACCDATQNEDWANCVAGTMRESELINLMQKAGFEDVVCTGYTHYTTAKTTQGATFQARKIPATHKRHQHWNGIFKSVDTTAVNWYESSPQLSLELIQKHSKKDENLIDVGCGTSYLADHLLENNYENITLLDISEHSLEIMKARLKSTKVSYVCEDILFFSAQEKFTLWHDRAAFHFLLSKKERQEYFSVLNNTLQTQGIAIIATFRVDGPLACAGLSIEQYDTQKMQEELPQNFTLLETHEHTHVTPKGTSQEYVYFVIQKRS